MTRRRYLTAKRKATIWIHQCECCVACGWPTELASMEWDHILPLCLGGNNRDENWQGICAGCHKRKTAREHGMRAKADRQRKFHEGTKKRRGRAMQSRGFDKRLRKRFDGTVEVRT